MVYGADTFLILSKDSRQPPGQYSIGTWDETEYLQLSTAETVDKVAEIIELEEVLYSKKLDSLEPKGPQATFSANFKNLEVPRNIIAHNNLLSKEEFYDFRRNVERLIKILKAYLR